MARSSEEACCVASTVASFGSKSNDSSYALATPASSTSVASGWTATSTFTCYPRFLELCSSSLRPID